MVFRRLSWLLANVIVLSMLLLIARPAHSSTSIHPATSTLPPATQPLVEYVGGFGGQLAGVAVNGTVAYIGEGSSLTVLDIGDTTHPARAARLPLAGLPSDLALADARLYVAAGKSGLLIYDVSDPLAPALLGTFATPVPATRVRVQSGLAYVVAGNLLIVDMHDPALPLLRGSYDVGAPINDIALAGNRAYLSYGDTFSAHSGGLLIVDVSDPAAPAALGGLSLTNEAAVGVQTSGDFVYVLTYVSDIGSIGNPRLMIVDVQNTAAPAVRGSYPIALDSFRDGGRLVIANGLAFIGGSSSGLLIVDVHSPSAPALISQDAAAGGGGGLQLVGDLLFAVTAGIGYITPGFQIIDVHTPAVPTQLGGYYALPLVRGVNVLQGNAYVAEYSHGFQIADVRDPAQPIMRGAYSIGGAPSRMQVVGNLAYITGGNSGLNILDISDLDNPVRLGGLAPNGSTMDIRVVGTLAYIAMINQLAIVDVSNAANPVQLGVFSQTTGYPDAGVDVLSNRAYFATGNQGIVIIDVSDPAHPVKRGAYTALARASHIQIVGSRAFVAAGSDGLVILDLTNPDSPVLLGRSSTLRYAFYVHVVDGLAYVADYYGGVQIIDVRNPADPVLVAQYDTAGSVTNVDVAGDLMYVPAGRAGLHIVRLHLDRFAARSAITPAGGEVTTVDGGISLSVPTGAITSTATVTITPEFDQAALPDGGQRTLRAAALEARDGDGRPIARFDQPYTLTLSYTDDQVTALKLDEANLHVVYWDGGTWVQPPPCAGCGTDPTANRVRLTTDRVAAFALVGSVRPAITSTAPPASATVGRPYGHVFTATGNPAPTFQVSVGALPPGLSLDSVGGILAGTPTEPGTFTFTVAAGNGTPPEATQDVTLTVRSTVYLPLTLGVH